MKMAYHISHPVHHRSKKNDTPPESPKPDNYTPWPMLILITILILYYIFNN
jgi:fatty acid desaturase